MIEIGIHIKGKLFPVIFAETKANKNTNPPLGFQNL